MLHICNRSCLLFSGGHNSDGNQMIANRAANSQTLVWDLRLFVILQTFLLLFFIHAWNQDVFAHLITKPPASTLEFKNFDSILQKISVIPNKNGKSASTQLAPPVPGQAYGSNTYVKHFAKFPDFLETQCWQPWLPRA